MDDWGSSSENLIGSRSHRPLKIFETKFGGIEALCHMKPRSFSILEIVLGMCIIHQGQGHIGHKQFRNKGLDQIWFS